MNIGRNNYYDLMFFLMGNRYVNEAFETLGLDRLIRFINFVVVGVFIIFFN